MFIAVAVPDHYDKIQDTLTNSSRNSAKPSEDGQNSLLSDSNYRNRSHDDKSPDVQDLVI